MHDWHLFTRLHNGIHIAHFWTYLYQRRYLFCLWCEWQRGRDGSMRLYHPVKDDYGHIFVNHLSIIMSYTCKLTIPPGVLGQTKICVFLITRPTHPFFADRLRFLCPAPIWPRDIMFPGCPSLLSVRPSVRHVLGVPLCVQRPAKTMPFQQIIMHALQCQHDLDTVHLLFCFDLNLHITSSRGRV